MRAIKFKNNDYLDSTGVMHNKIKLNEVLQKNIMQLTTSTESYNIGVNNIYEKVKLNKKVFSLGKNKLIFDSQNYAIKIGSGVSKVKVNAEISVVKGSSGLIYLRLVVGNTVVGSNEYSDANRRTKVICNTCSNVKENDLIYFETYGSTTDSITGPECFTQLIVEVLE